MVRRGGLGRVHGSRTSPVRLGTAREKSMADTRGRLWERKLVDRVPEPRTMRLVVVGFGEREKMRWRGEGDKQDKHQSCLDVTLQTPTHASRFFFGISSLLTLIMAAVRLRKAFRYPEDSDGDREELDEEEQEQVIQQLQRQNDARNAQYSVHIHPPLL